MTTQNMRSVSIVHFPFTRPSTLTRSSVAKRKLRALRLCGVSVFLLFLLTSPCQLIAQSATGNIRGSISDQSGAAVAGAHVIVTDEATAKTVTAISQSDGTYQVLELLPGNYTITVSSQGFKDAKSLHVTVQLATVTQLSIHLEVGTAHQEVTVADTDIVSQVDTQTTEVGGVITTQQVEQLALSGRNVFDLAQLEPGVQIRDGSSLVLYNANRETISIDGRSGRGVQSQWDGLSVQDNAYGGSVVQIGLEGIQEFQVAEASRNPAQGVASGGAINVISRRGANDLHGSGFDFIRNRNIAAQVGPQQTPYDRYQLGGRLGGRIIKDKLFFFVDAERTDSRDTFVVSSPVFTSLAGVYSKPFTDNFGMVRLDWNPTSHFSLFARENYGWNQGVTGSSVGGSQLQPVSSANHNQIQALVATLSNSHWVHTWSVGHVYYLQRIAPSIYGFPTPHDSAGNTYSITIAGGNNLSYGPNIFNTFTGERSTQGKYDAAWVGRGHALRFGGALSYFAMLSAYPFLPGGPSLTSSAVTSPTPADPTSYPLSSFTVSNGFGFTSPRPGLGSPYGGSINWQPEFYIHDTMTLGHNVSLNFGIRYMYQTGIFNSYLKRPALLNDFKAGYGNSTTNPKRDFAPEVGVAWDPTGAGKMVIRASAGLYDESLTFNSYFTDTQALVPASVSYNLPFLAAGSALVDPRSRTQSPFAAGDPLAASYGFPNGTSGTALAGLFGQPIGTVASQVANLQRLLHAASVQALGLPSQTLFENTHQINSTAAIFQPHPIVPKVIQINAGVQRELRRGLIASIGYVKVRALDFNIIVDENHLGAATSSTFDSKAAASAIARGNASVGCPADANAASIDCAIGKKATITTYSKFGLGKGLASQGFAFRGDNPNFGQMNVWEPKSFGDYNALNVKVEERSGPVEKKGMSWIRGNSVSASYALSRYRGNARGLADQAAYDSAWDTENPSSSQWIGPSGLDRTSMFSVGTVTEIQGGFRFSVIGHLFSALPQNTTLPTGRGGCKGGSEEIFCSDVTGDGTTGDLLQTAGGPGQFGRGLHGAAGLNKAISSYDSQFAGQLTPAGQLLVSQSFFTTSQLQSLGAVMPTISLAPQGQANIDPLLLTDVRLSYHRKIRERVEWEITFDAFNAFNHMSYDGGGNELSGVLTGTRGSINGTTPQQRIGNAASTKLLRGSGTFDQGAPRTMQVGMRLSF